MKVNTDIFRINQTLLTNSNSSRVYSPVPVIRWCHDLVIAGQLCQLNAQLGPSNESNYAQLQYTLLSFTAQHYQFFPMSMGQILREFAVAEMHLTLNSGRWRYDKWGFPENPAVASGAELWAWMAEGGPMR
jgi:hypothetical protein